MHGSTVTYSVVLANGRAGGGDGVSKGSARIASIASSSACRVACCRARSTGKRPSGEHGAEVTHVSQLVRPVARASDDDSIAHEHAPDGYFTCG